MTTHFIDEDAAKLADDLLTKIRLGHISIEHLKWFLDTSKSEREALMLGKKLKPKPVVKAKEKFVMLADLGVITVPQDQFHTVEFLMAYKDEYEKHYTNALTLGGTFLNPDRILKTGDRLQARVFRKISDSVPVIAEDLFAFFAKEKAIFTGLQGANLVLKLRRTLLPIGIPCISFETKMNLWFPDTVPPVPYVEAVSHEEFFTSSIDFYFAYQSKDVAFLVFTDVSAEVLTKEGVPPDSFAQAPAKAGDLEKNELVASHGFSRW